MPLTLSSLASRRVASTKTYRINFVYLRRLARSISRRARKLILAGIANAIAANQSDVLTHAASGWAGDEISGWNGFPSTDGRTAAV